MHKILVWIPLLLSIGFSKASGIDTSQPKVTFSKLQQLINDNKIKSVQGLASFVTKNYPYRVMLMHTPRGQQPGSYSKPRVLLFFGENFDSAIAYHGESTKEGFNDVEVITPTGSPPFIEFNQIHFPSDEKKEQEAVRFAPPPKECFGCHRNHFNIDTYPFWVGAYGSEEEIYDNTREGAEFKKFLVNEKDNPRYKLLNLTVESFSNGPEGHKNGVKVKQFNLVTLNANISKTNAKRLSQIVLQTPDYEKLRFAILGALKGCDNIDSFLPAKMKTDFDAKIKNLLKKKQLPIEENALQSIKEATRAAQEAYLRSKVKRNEEVTQTVARFHLEDAPKGSQSGAVGSLRYLLESRGIDMNDWFAICSKGTYHPDQMYLFETMFDTLRSNLEQSMPEVKKWPKDMELCVKLKEASLASLDSREDPESQPHQKEPTH